MERKDKKSIVWDRNDGERVFGGIKKGMVREDVFPREKAILGENKKAPVKTRSELDKVTGLDTEI
jgi:hypothetical protein